MKRSKKKQQVIIEEQDSLGISRKKWDHTISLKLFVILKIICIALIPIVYFVYSPFLIVCMVAYVSLFFLSIMAERRINTSVIKSNHIKIPKLDSALALIIIVISLFGVCMSGTSKVKKPSFENAPDFSNVKEIDFDGARKNMWLREFTNTLKNFGSLLTGERSVFSGGKQSFGMKEAPKDFPKDMSELPEGMPSFEGRPTRPNIDFDIDDLPIEYLFSSILTTVNTVLIFSVSGAGIISLLVLYVKQRKFENIMNDIVITEDVTLTDEEIDRILSFGELVIEKTVDAKETLDSIDSIDNVNIYNETKKENNESQELLQKEVVNEEENISILDDNFNLDKIYED